MQNLISNTLGSSSFVILNKAVIKALGMHEAVALGFLIDKWAYFQHADFYYTIQDLSNDTDLSERECRNIVRKLVDKGILIKRAFEGIPPKQYYNINQNAIIDILKNPMPKKENPTLENPTKDLTLADSNPFKSDTFNPCKNDRVNTCKNDRVNTCKNDSDIYSNNKVSNNKVSNNKVSNNKDKEKNTKKEKDCVSLFQDTESLLNENSSDYKIEFEKIWSLYPNKQGKQIALQSYINARKGVKKRGIAIPPATFEIILQGVKNYLITQKGVEIRFIKHLSTFLNQATYLDFQSDVNLNRRVGVIDDHPDYVNADKSKYIPK